MIRHALRRVLVGTVVLLFAACGGGAGGGNDAGTTGGPPGNALKATLTVVVLGSGDGTVTVKADKSGYDPAFNVVSCAKSGGTCTTTVDLDAHGATMLTLTATPASSSGFYRWSDGCSVSASDPAKAELQMNVETDYLCTARFWACNNPYVISSAFDTDADWERNEFGTGVTGSNPASGGNPGGYRLGGLDRNISAYASYDVHAVHLETYDPAVRGAITGITYQEDRFVSGSPQAYEGLQSGLWFMQGIGQFQVLVDETPPFSDPAWTTFTVHLELDQLGLDPNVAFRPGYARRVSTTPGTGTLEHGIDNVQFSICR